MMLQTAWGHSLMGSSVCPAVSLKPDLFEGLKFDFNKPLNMNFALSHRQEDLHAPQQAPVRTAIFGHGNCGVPSAACR